MASLIKGKIVVNKKWLLRRIKKYNEQFVLDITQEEYEELMGLKKERKVRTASQKKTKELDDLCSEYVRKRAILRVGGCERCHHKKTSYKELQWAHYIARGKKSVRWDPDNAAGLCPPCHMHLDNHPVEKLSFFYELLGKDKISELANLEKSTVKVDKQAVKNELTRLLESV